MCYRFQQGLRDEVTHPYRQSALYIRQKTDIILQCNQLFLCVCVKYCVVQLRLKSQHPFTCAQ